MIPPYARHLTHDAGTYLTVEGQVEIIFPWKGVEERFAVQSKEHTSPPSRLAQAPDSWRTWADLMPEDQQSEVVL